MKLKYDFIVNEVADQFVAVAVGDALSEFNGFVKMNDVGASIFDKLKNDISMEDLIALMAKEYPDETVETITDCVTGFIDGLKEKDLIA
ncbi:MAG: PqqD family protein [Clostridia bacterium]|nr:PqqD family protein [Clostridia bacterium]